MDKMDEQIVVVQRASIELTAGPLAQGVITDEAYVKQALAVLLEDFDVMRRGNAETNTSYKQPIPYVMLMKHEDGVDYVFAYERLEAGGEVRLHGKLSIGLGGHMNYFSATALYAEMMRELEEELQWKLNVNPDADPDPFLVAHSVIGLINDDSNEVGQVHLGLLVKAISSPDWDVTVRETDQLRGEWVRVDDMLDAKRFERLENWSQLAIRALA